MTNSPQYGGTSVPAVATQQFISQLIELLHCTKRSISKAVTVRATKAYTDNGGIAPLTHSFGARRDCDTFKHRHAPDDLAPEKVLFAPNDTEAG